MAHALHNGPVYLGAPPALEVPKALDLECLISPCSIRSCSGAPGSSNVLMVAKGNPLDLGAPRALVTDETFSDNETYTCMTHLGVPRATFYSGAPASYRGPHDHQRVQLALDLRALGAALGAN